jgi:hypothetical protein
VFQACQLFAAERCTRSLLFRFFFFSFETS